MEILFYYLIASISFMLMYTYRYGYEITLTVLDVLKELDIDYTEHNWSPITHTFAVAILSLIAMPLFFMVMLSEHRYVTIKEASKLILNRRFDLKTKE